MTEAVSKIIEEGLKHLALGFPRASLFYFQEAINLAPQIAEPHCCAGTVYLRLGKPDEALKEFQQAARLDPENSEAYSGMASALRQQGDRASQSVLLEYASSLPANSWRHYMILGDLAESRKDYNAALSYYRNAQTDAVGVRGLEGCIGYAMLRLRQYGEAQQMLMRAVEADPSDAAAFYNLGLSEQKLHHNAAAYQAFQSAIMLNPAHVRAIAQLSRLDLRFGRWRSAWTYFIRGVRIDISVQAQQSARGRRA